MRTRARRRHDARDEVKRGGLTSRFTLAALLSDWGGLRVNAHPYVGRTAGGGSRVNAHLYDVVLVRAILNIYNKFTVARV